MRKRIVIWLMMLFFYLTTTAGLAACASVHPNVVEETPALVLTAEDQRQIQCLAENVYHEARGESEEGQEAVALVVRNRVESGEFPSDICGVVWQHASSHRCQFSWTCDGHSDRIRDHETYEDILWRMTQFYVSKTFDFTGGATYYHASYVRPRWSRDFIRTAQIGAHIFYRG